METSCDMQPRLPLDWTLAGEFITTLHTTDAAKQLPDDILFRIPRLSSYSLESRP